MSQTFSPPPFGIYTPAVTFFAEDESIDFAATEQHLARLLDAGVTGLVIHGSNGEATHLLPEEKVEVIQAARRLITEKGPKATIMAGCSANSVRETVQALRAAHAAGADHALVLPPNYWAAAMTKPVLKSYFLDVAAQSPLPIVLYNFPGVRSGIDLDSDMIGELAREAPQIVGVKLTCGNIGKLQRLSAEFDAARFAPLVGKGDFLLPGLVVGGQGAISALANVVPKLHIELVRLYQAGELAKAQEIQKLLSVADWALQKGGISGVKAAVGKWYGYGNPRARAPLPTVSDAVFAAGVDAIQKVVDLENEL
ncbi:putative 4-hydroxy-2-oxoglutarate aldolase like protein [Verticillium longisporum]|uniref:Putative 4-hydroxy-2-oxoglutarate aldolase like protein n=1 Tax=Verticillium longisporum TaxID=100787 RepID=A0A8I2ZIU7_VERLO|nr:putative 4-hydroxy-2-oxoglutarate aldolase like protein [Verticillium longisporum]